MNTGEYVWAFVVGFFVGSICTMAVAVLIGKTPAHYGQLQKQAIFHGAAEWRANPATGETEFVWLKRD